ncbi:hypothetical protein Tco_1386628 [Tanacetum coccineum]
MTTPSPSPPISLSPPSTKERLVRSMAPPAHLSPLPMPSPLLPSSGCPTQIQTLRIASTQTLIDAVTTALPSPSLPPLLSIQILIEEELWLNQLLNLGDLLKGSGSYIFLEVDDLQITQINFICQQLKAFIIDIEERPLFLVKGYFNKITIDERPQYHTFPLKLVFSELKRLWRMHLPGYVLRVSIRDHDCASKSQHQHLLCVSDGHPVEVEMDVVLEADAFRFPLDSLNLGHQLSEEVFRQNLEAAESDSSSLFVDLPGLIS